MATPLSDVRDHLPLKPLDLWILLVLTDGMRHGYGIVKEIESRTNGQMRPVPGNFYAVLGRLMEAGLIAPGHRQRSVKTAKARRNYRITRLGRKVAIAEIERLRQVVDAACSLPLMMP